MKYIEEKLILDFFSLINSNDIRYLMIKNINNELPVFLRSGKDIDIVVAKEDRNRLKEILVDNGFCQEIHPYDKSRGWRQLYGLNEFDFFKKVGSELYIDITDKLCCKGIQPFTFVPLDSCIQKYIWDTREWDSINRWWIMEKNARFAYYIIRSVFDKRKFNELYIAEIERSINDISEDIVFYLLKPVFFSYTGRLLGLIKDKKYDEIVSDYITFVEY